MQIMSQTKLAWEVVEKKENWELRVRKGYKVWLSDEK